MAKKKRRRQGGGRAGAPLPAGPALSAEEQAARREQQRRDWANEKRRAERSEGSLAPFFWAGGGAATIVGVVLVIVLIVAGGSGSESAAVTSTPDPRVAGETPEETFTIEAGDSGQATGTYFEPNVINARVGEVIEIVVTNAGSVAHNLRVSGLDKEYDTRDDWVTDPATLFSGDEGRFLLKINEPGQYPFQCDFHPTTQVGTLVIN